MPQSGLFQPIAEGQQIGMADGVISPRNCYALVKNVLQVFRRMILSERAKDMTSTSNEGGRIAPIFDYRYMLTSRHGHCTKCAR